MTEVNSLVKELIKELVKVSRVEIESAPEEPKRLPPIDYAWDGSSGGLAGAAALMSTHESIRVRRADGSLAMTLSLPGRLSTISPVDAIWMDVEEVMMDAAEAFSTHGDITAEEFLQAAVLASRLFKQ